jgi:hypothetical protein
MSLLGKLFANAAANDDEITFRPSRKFTARDIQRIAERGAAEFRSTNINVLSLFELEGEFGLYSTLNNYVQTKAAMTAEVTEAMSDGDEIALTQAFMRALEQSFVDLLEKGALKRIQLTENWTPEATVEYASLLRSVAATKAANATQAAATVPATAPAPGVPVVRETPVETCAREFREMPSSKWKAKWLHDQRNRPVTDQAAAEGRI